MDENAKKIVQANIKRLVKSRGMTQKDIADRSDIPTTTIRSYFSQTLLPTPGNTEKLSRLFNVTKEQIDPRFNSDTFTQFDISAAKEQLNDNQSEFLEKMLEKALSLSESEREDFFKNVRFAIEIFDKNRELI